ncbi:cytochrome D1 domain-containing protein [Nostocoides jenkinsii]|nr:YncE family protein [Tetrasphaera jenkinsii]
MPLPQQVEGEDEPRPMRVRPASGRPTPSARAGGQVRHQTLPPPSVHRASPIGAPAPARPKPGGRGPGGPSGTGPRVPRQRPPKPNYTARRLIAVAILVALLSVTWFTVKAVAGFIGGLFDGGTTTSASRVPATANATGESATWSPGTTGASLPPQAIVPEVPAPTPTPAEKQGAAGASDVTTMVRTMRLAAANMSPKSVVAGPAGLLFAQNMMYHHSISVFRADGALLKTIPDSVDLSKFGIAGHAGVSQGAPVEMAFTPDGKYAWVSNYSMYGAGFGPEGLDRCTAGDGTSTSYVYRVDTATLAIDKVVPVGAVPKYVAVTPDGNDVLVSNWCSWSLSVIDAKTATPKASIDLGGKYPRGIVVSPDSKTAYVALMGSGRVVSVDIANKTVAPFSQPGSGPRHLVNSPDGAFIFVTLNNDGTVAKVDRATGNVVATVRTASEPRSMTISSDGKAIYVVNYGSASMSKIRTSDMSVLQTVATDASPIGITYEPTRKQVWVACYGGSVIVFDDAKLKG